MTSIYVCPTLHYTAADLAVSVKLPTDHSWQLLHQLNTIHRHHRMTTLTRKYVASKIKPHLKIIEKQHTRECLITMLTEKHTTRKKLQVKHF